ncbi:outer membrane protein OmpK [Vibrio intestinalis]|uniref:nucleoside-specific channel-forming Tsx family protein n=1 Tax=Vibrio intestinalis TaxID=2933291 RepID=UPI0021A2D442|nr:outer membrane protein OmpK [Vibrio intestinalis]
MRKSLLALGVVAAMSTPAMAADYSDGNTHKNDYKWFQFNIMGAFDELPGESSHDYIEMEFGGRSGIFDLYGYIDFFNVLNSDGSDKSGSDRIFAKINPRMSLDGLTGKDLSFGPVQELYFANQIVINGGGEYTYLDSNGQPMVDGDGNIRKADKPTYNIYTGIGSDVMVPWFGKVGVNAYAKYDMNAKEFNGYQVSLNWFKPFHFFENGSFISYQGYLDYEFGIEKTEIAGTPLNSSNGGAMYNGIYWHNDQFALGYGLKLYNEVYGLADGGIAGKTSGVAHYIAATYKF